MSSEVAIRVRDVAKHYALFDRPEDRLKQMIVPRLQRMAGRPATRYFRPFAALSNVTFDVHRGETVGIVGRNGSGKSTLLQIICGTLAPTVGTVEVNGRIAALLELGSGFNPQFTGRENVFLYAAILGLSREETERRFDDIAGFADIGLFIDQPVKTYSSGMYVRLAFATAINVDPDILVVDEALAVGDEAFQRKCYARIEDIKDNGGTILFVSHGAQTIVQLCDRALLMDAGELILAGRPKTVVSQYQRLANASAEGAAEIRASILHVRDAPEETVAVAVQAPMADGQDAAAFPATVTAPAPSNDWNTDYLDPNLIPQSTIHQEQRGACISEVRITTLDGKTVNVLRMGKRYAIRFVVSILEPFDAIDFGTTFRTTSGLAIAGCMTNRVRGHHVSNVLAGESIEVEIETDNILLPGKYFVNVAAFARRSGHEFIAHRIIDALMIAVAVEEDLISTGLVDAAMSVRTRRDTT